MRELEEKTRWDWGDARTWVVIAVLFLISLAIAGLAYVMPKGRVASQPSIHTY